LVSSGRITFEIPEEEEKEEEFLKKMLEKFKTENVILKQADVAKIMEIKKMKADFVVALLILMVAMLCSVL
jgi:hypothetical protein